MVLVTPVAASAQEDEPKPSDQPELPVLTDPLELDVLRLAPVGYEFDSANFDLESTTDTEVGWMADAMYRATWAAVAADALVASELRVARADRAAAWIDVRAETTMLAQLDSALAAAAVMGYLGESDAEVGQVLAPNLDLIANVAVANYATDQILAERVVAREELEVAKEILQDKAAKLRLVEGHKTASEAVVVEAEDALAVFEARVERHGVIAERADQAADRLGNVVATPAEGQLVTGEAVGLQSVAGVLNVNAEIEDRLDALIAHARADGIELSGGAYRTVESQIVLRLAHCGGAAPATPDGGSPADPAPETLADTGDVIPDAAATEGAPPVDPAAAAAAALAWRNYVIYQAPASSCSPPTAIPGQSQHQTGLAVDFTENGSILTWQSPAFFWLVNNAERFGFYNLPSEAWHWSTTGH